MERWVQSWRPRTAADCDFFHSMSLKYCPHHEKVDARSYEVLHLSRRIIWANLKIWCSEMQPFYTNQRPDLLLSLMNMSPVLRLPNDMHLCEPPSNFPRLPLFLDMLQNPIKPSCFAHFWHCTPSPAPAARNDIWMSIKVARVWNALHILTSTCSSHHKSVQLFISHLAKWLRTRHFSEPAFHDPVEAQIIGKTQWITTFPPLRSHASSFFSLFLFSDRVSSSLLLSDSSHRCFSIRPFCRKFGF